MVSSQQTRVVVKELRRAGWSPARTVGSHTTWVSPSGKRTVSVPDGHRMISPGVYRKIARAIAEEQAETNEEGTK